METFRTSYRRDFPWPWALPVRLTAWGPPERTFARPRDCPPPPCPECPCPEHTWVPALGHYVCLAGKEARLHQRSQGVRAEIQRCLSRTEDAEKARRSKFPSLPGGAEWLSIYMTDYVQRDRVPQLSYVDLLTELVSTGIPRAPLGRTLFASYDDGTKLRRSFHTAPPYDPSKPVEARPIRDIWEIWYKDFPMESEYTDAFSHAASRTTRKSQPFKYPLLPDLPVG